ncbi:MAG: porphobilinogen synthase [Thermoplasmatota archaeon]
MRSRPRRLRSSPLVRDLAAETRLSPANLVVPRFVIPGRSRREKIESMPGVERLTVDHIVEETRRDLDLGLRSTLLFGIPSAKDPTGAGAADDAGPVPSALSALRKEFGKDIHLIADVCLCEYTEHGHCGLPDAHGNIRNDASLPLLADAALAYARAGADWVAPSDMMDGRVAAIRDRLDREGLEDTAILSYSAKYASAYYGPFREAAGSAPQFGDRRSYQMDSRNVREALKECAADEAEGADALMVKPALAYLDVIRAVRERTHLPLAAYNVSGEYAQVKLMAKAGYADEGALVRENLTAIKRAGADIILTYHARDAVANGWLP